MASLTVMIFLLSSLACSFAADQRLNLTRYSEDEVKGCYIHNQTLGICFDVKLNGDIKIEKTTGEQIVRYLILGPEMFFYQVLDQAFIAHGPNMIHVPNDVSRQPWPEALRAFVDQISSENSIEQHRAQEIHTEAAVSELRSVPEIQLLELVAATLGANSTRLQILQSFYALCSNLLEVSDVPIPSELRAALDMGEESADQQKRSYTQPTENDCRGMCGAKCNCWESVCGDCCYHRGCYEHDLCCKHAGYFSFYCLSVIGTFSYDKGVAFYPKCLEGPGWSLPW